MPDKLAQILKFHERVISALILVASFARPEFGKLLRRVSKVLKFANIDFYKFKVFFLC